MQPTFGLQLMQRQTTVTTTYDKSTTMTLLSAANVHLQIRVNAETKTTTKKTFGAMQRK